MNEHAKLLFHEVIRGLESAPLVKIDIQAFADTLSVTLRSAQRYVAELEIYKGKKYEIYRRRNDGARYFKTLESISFGALMADDDRVFLPLPETTNDRNDRNDKPLIVNYIFIRDLKEKKEDLKKGLSFHNRETTIADSNGDKPVDVTIWYDETSGAMQELASAVCHVCKLSALLLLDEDEAKIAKLFKAGVEGPAVMQRYAYENRPNYWWSGHWKGRDKNSRPTIIDLMRTWEMSHGYVYKPQHAWPPVSEIQKTITTIMVQVGAKKPQTAIDEMSKYGYDEIIRRIPGGYVHMTRMPLEKMHIEIAKAVRSIREEEKTLVTE